MKEAVYPKLNSVVTEKALIGSVLMSPENFLIVNWLKPSQFYDSTHESIWSSIIDLFNAGANLDLHVLSAAMIKKGESPDIAVGYLMDVFKTGVGSEDVLKLAQFVYDLAVKRDMYIFLERKIDDFGNLAIDTEDVTDEIVLKITNLHNSLYSAESMSIKEVMNDAREQILRRKYKEEAVDDLHFNVGNIVIPNGFVILAARPSMGKSSLAIQICNNLAIDQNIPVALFELEMSKEQIVRWIISQRTQIDNERLRTGGITDKEEAIMEEKISKIEAAPLFIDDKASMNVMQLRSKAIKLKNKYGIKCVIIDYLQLMSGMDSKGKLRNRENEVSEISRQLKILSKELGIPVIALAQLNREVVGRADKKPRLSDLRESGSLEQDADMVMFIHRPSYYGIDNFEDGSSTENVAQIIVEKYRDGALRCVDVQFIPEKVTFRNFGGNEDWPEPRQYKDDDKF